jgi:hypothetical protein
VDPRVAWIAASVYDSIINKTPLSYRTNRLVGGAAPSEYLAKLEKGNAENPPIPRERLDDYLRSHLIDPGHLRVNSFDVFMADRQLQLLKLIEAAMGKPAHGGGVRDEGADAEADEDTVEAELTIAAE